MGYAAIEFGVIGLAWGTIFAVAPSLIPWAVGVGVAAWLYTMVVVGRYYVRYGPGPWWPWRS